MAANTNTDLTEEDAADLQFPKEIRNRQEEHMKFLHINVGSECTNCKNQLPSVYILCEECNLNLCPRCFADGVEFSSHKNDHDYRVLNDQFILFENSKWSARDELTLLNGLIRLGSWSTIGKMLPNYTIKEIKEHYEHFYIDRRGSDLLPEFPGASRGSYIEPIVPYRFKTVNIIEPPRNPLSITAGSYLSGYNASRSDFELDYDAGAEDLLSKLEVPRVDDPNYEMLVDLQYAIFNIYNRRLQERARRKSIIRRHGLIVPRKVSAWLRRYDTTITPNVCEKMVRFMQFCDGEQFEYVMEGLHKAGELKVQIARLCEFRRKGITTLAGANLYLTLKAENEEHTRNYKSFQNSPYFRLENKEVTVFPKKNRGEFTPINIVGMPGYEKLDQKERELCTNIRLVPISYLEFKALLIQENNKSGSLRLAVARRQLKIDVNKTRRLYDFLAAEGYITKPN